MEFIVTYEDFPYEIIEKKYEKVHGVNTEMYYIRKVDSWDIIKVEKLDLYIADTDNIRILEDYDDMIKEQNIKKVKKKLPVVVIDYTKDKLMRKPIIEVDKETDLYITYEI